MPVRPGFLRKMSYKLTIFERKVLRKYLDLPNNKMVYGELKQMKS
jgi:hypothetical protein